MTAPMQVINFQQWIDDNRDKLKPPVCNKEVYREGDMIIMVVGGPNGRRDYHFNEGPEFFYQLEGEMLLRTQQNGKIVDYPIKQGEIFLLPAKIPHSPIRYANSIGLVIEQVRRPEENDGLMWFCENCNHKLYEEYFHLTDVEKDFFPVFDRFLNSEQHRTCDQCQTVMPKQNKLQLEGVAPGTPI
ncbi:3-hydroxyanthranilate 3,4-dioxygenase [Pleionea sp. CnH1-48]|uniref:3-hydroxyanthranilate 3,4-dioxygenase n=1 Tax=Pleionea sp. CnH1-48 TaxID=2954494 RepID=UPI0020972CB6|nr:3-hydroxyanthranilate 3,4-dioxygenase [Pleionea sp. CnH1-48]MCO7227338.1 3-hydroxyanthranilate 3,4-dioxygenase [Pleionea sp. CnH1-48]